ncbi:hypothetical protein ILUMI_03855 [Ignelater luminosus]|uniref:Uncharacterized protein n=1 Tax=Ignelater luminosus TaxID=2038154 RepID=A0A8K0DFF8_IGNLU|nr:hypothetical protein ILUMI_03855 [Ignelater luminosus]
MNQYFDVLEDVMKKYQFPPGRIYNADETGIQTVLNKLPKHVAPTGKKDIAKAVSAKQGQTMSAISTLKVASADFRSTGIYLVDRTVSGEIDFLSSEVTVQELDPDFDKNDRVFVQFDGAEQEQGVASTTLSSTVLPVSPSIVEDVGTNSSTYTVPILVTPTLLLRPANVIEQQHTSPADIIPAPKPKIARKRIGRGLKAAHLTSTPNKNRLEEVTREKARKENEKQRKAEERNRKQKKRIKRNLKKLRLL